MVAVELRLPADLMALSTRILLHVSKLQDIGDGSAERQHQVLCLSERQHYVDCIEFDSVVPGHRIPSAFLSLTFLSEIESCPLKE